MANINLDTHQHLFEAIRRTLMKEFPDLIRIEDEGNFLAVGDSGVWVSLVDGAITVGDGFIHQHYDLPESDLAEAVDRFFWLLTCQRKITSWAKGNKVYRNQVELLLHSGDTINQGTAMTWWVPFWKKTRKMEVIEGPVLEKDFSGEVERLKSEICS